MSNLPRGWTLATVEDCAAPEPGALTDGPYGSNLKTSHYTAVGPRVIRLGNITAGTLDMSDEAHIAKGHFDALARHHVRPGDVVVAALGDPIGRACRVPDDIGPAMVKADCFRLRPGDHVDAHYLVNWFNCIDAREAFLAASHGMGRIRVNLSDVRASPIPLPPLPEQRRIVAKLDRLSARSRAARDHLARTTKLAARAKQAILDAAFSAGLPTAELRTMVDPVRGIPYGIVQTGTHTPGGVPTIRCGDIKRFSVATEGLKLVDRQISNDYRRTILRGGEVLIAIRGSVGETCVVPGSLAGCNISREVAMIPVIGTVSASFVMYFLRSREASQFILANIKGVAQTGINLADLRTLPTPVLALEEQARVVREIEAAFARIDRMTAEAARAVHLLDRLDERVLAKAFRGELVPQDPADEPAEALLARVRAKRVEAPRPRRGRRARTS